MRPPVSQDRRNIEKPAPVNPLREVWKGGRVCLSPPVSGDWSTRIKRLSTGFNSRTPGELMKVYQKPTIRQVVDNGSGGRTWGLALPRYRKKRGLRALRNASERGAPHAPDIATALPLAGCWQSKAGASEKTGEKKAVLLNGKRKNQYFGVYSSKS